MTENDLVLTGIPRSGTTLLAAFVDSLEDAVALSEPPGPDRLLRRTTDARRYGELLREEFAAARRRLLGREEIADRRTTDGRTVTDYYRDRDGARQAREPVTVKIDRPLSPDFLLAVKHNAHFTSVLPELVAGGGLAVVALIRHPVAVIRSWRSVPLPLRDGRLPAAELLWPEVRAVVAGTEDLLERQARIYELFCVRYRELEPAIALMRYEDLVTRPGLVAERLQRRFARPPPPIEPPTSTSERDVEGERIAAAVRRFAPVACSLYPDVLS